MTQDTISTGIQSPPIPAAVLSEKSSAKSSNEKYRGVGGWLTLFSFGNMVGSPLFTLINLVKELDLLPSFSSPSYPTMLLAIGLDCVLMSALGIFGCYAGFCLYRVRPHAVHLAKQYLIGVVAYAVFGLAFNLLAIVINPPAGLEHDKFLTEVFVPLARMVMYASIWKSYFNKSKRVAATYNPEGKPSPGYFSLWVMWAVFLLSLGVIIFTLASVSVSGRVVRIQNEPAVYVMLGALITILFRCMFIKKQEIGGQSNLSNRKILLVAVTTSLIVISGAGAWGGKHGTELLKLQHIESFANNATAASQAVKRVEDMLGSKLQTTQDYTTVYAEIEAPLQEWKASIERAKKDLELIRKDGISEKLSQMFAVDEEIMDAASRRIEVIEKQVKVIQRMASLPNNVQVDFWKENYWPLQQQHTEIVREINVLQEKLRNSNPKQ